MSINFKRIQKENDYILGLIKQEVGIYQRNRNDQDLQNKSNLNQMYLILNHKQAVGFVSYQYDRDYLFLESMVIDQKSQHQGVGRKVIERLEREAKKRNKQGIYSFIVKKNEQAVDDFHKYGFVVSGEGKKYWIMEKTWTKNQKDPMQERHLKIHYPL